MRIGVLLGLAGFLAACAQAPPDDSLTPVTGGWVLYPPVSAEGADRLLVD